jgi:hypothetical protein
MAEENERTKGPFDPLQLHNSAPGVEGVMPILSEQPQPSFVNYVEWSGGERFKHTLTAFRRRRMLSCGAELIGHPLL